ncbi:conserved uncharacterized protein, DUF302 [Desulfosarcina variabilis str. Montpellier]|uniref:DUF302 domain-containing protein n=1 Tax=Desulfosarcina variabilis TaxID=2300 RepID=UPI003AFAAAA1
MKKFLLILMLNLLFVATAAAQGVISVKSNYGVATTANRLEKALQEKGITVFARIDHADGARSVGQTLKPTILVIFGTPAMGTPLIERSRTMGIDLPMKALVWEDKAGKVWFSYNDPDYLFRRHGLTEMSAAMQNLQQTLAGLAAAATQP